MSDPISLARQYAEFLRYGKRVFWKRDALPLYLIFFVTSRCHMRCGHCFNWRRAATEGTDLSLDEYRRVSSKLHDLVFLFLSGGEPFLREDLSEIATLFHRQNRVQKMQSPSNGSLPESIQLQVERIARTCPDLHYTVTLSVDGLYEEHDRIRSYPGLFERVMESYRVLRLLRARYPNIGICFSITLSAANQNSALRTYRHLRETCEADNVYVILTRGEPRDPQARNIDLERLRELDEAVNQDLRAGHARGIAGFPFASFMNAKNVVSRDHVQRVAREGTYQTPCYAGLLAGNVFNDGDVRPCELRDVSLGNLRDNGYDLPALWRSERAESIRRAIREERCFCTHECFLTTNLLFNPRQLLAVGCEWARQQWTRRP